MPVGAGKGLALLQKCHIKPMFCLATSLTRKRTKVILTGADTADVEVEENAVKYRYGLGTAVLLASYVQAATIEYGANLDNSSWRLTQDSALECRLEHFIPGYGSGSFVSRAGKNINLDFELRPFRANARIQTVTLRSLPPRWRPGMPEGQLANIRFYKQFDGQVEGQTAWAMAGELEQGRIPAFLFRDWYHQGQTVQVSVSSVGFYARYQSFLMCLQGLLPYTFEDIAFTALSYEKNSDLLTPYSQRRLEMIGAYLKSDPSIDTLLVNAYTDSMGSRWGNQKLSEKRAEAIKRYFANLGIDPKRIQVQGHGEKQQVASNETEEGRATNRRVIISMARNLPTFEQRGLEIGEPIFTETSAAPVSSSAATNDVASAPADKAPQSAKAAASVAKKTNEPAIKAGPDPKTTPLKKAASAG